MNYRPITDDEARIAAKYLHRYPHLQALLERAPTSAQAAKQLCAAIAQVTAPDGITPQEMLKMSRLGMAR